MPNDKPSRKQMFRAALAITGLTATQWAQKQGITLGHLSQVLTGERESASLTAKVDSFIDKNLISNSALVA